MAIQNRMATKKQGFMDLVAEFQKIIPIITRAIPQRHIHTLMWEPNYFPASIWWRSKFGSSNAPAVKGYQNRVLVWAPVDNDIRALPD
jgi:hypothetical protein